eukprot:771349-Amorphochlora_amoeboformis.AAC.1
MCDVHETTQLTRRASSDFSRLSRVCLFSGGLRGELRFSKYLESVARHSSVYFDVHVFDLVGRLTEKQLLLLGEAFEHLEFKPNQDIIRQGEKVRDRAGEMDSTSFK